MSSITKNTNGGRVHSITIIIDANCAYMIYRLVNIWFLDKFFKVVDNKHYIPSLSSYL